MKYKYHINPKYEGLTSFVRRVASVYDREGILIHDSRDQLRIMKDQGKAMVVKRFCRLKWKERFDCTFSHTSKAQTAYANALKLLELGISTPEPIAYIEEYKYGLLRQDFLVMNYYSEDDTRLLRDEPGKHEALMDALVQFLVEMHEKGFLHGNASLANFLYREDAAAPTGYRITTIAIESAKWVENPSREECIGNLVGLTRSRSVLTDIVQKYAVLRGWNVEWATTLLKQKFEEFHKER